VQYAKLEVAANEPLGPGHHLLTLRAADRLPEMRAGEFANLRCVPDDMHSLLRPFSILGADPGKRELEIYYKVLGRQSALLVRTPVGSLLDCLFPLGRGFDWRPEWRRVALVGGGVGLAPLLFMAEQLQQRDPDVELTAYFGGNTEADLVPALLARYALDVQAATMDGSAGFRGNVVQLFSGSGAEYDVVYTCGPNPMMAALQAVVPAGRPAFASLEEYMACGVGACLGCTAAIEDDGRLVNRPVCKDGPVFPLHAVHFHN